MLVPLQRFSSWPVACSSCEPESGMSVFLRGHSAARLRFGACRALPLSSARRVSSSAMGSKRDAGSEL